MVKPKIIHIIGHSPGDAAYLEINDPLLKLPEHYVKMGNFPYWAGFFEEDFYAIVATKLSKLSSKFHNECWRPYYNCDKIYQKKINGVTHKIFPSSSPKKLRFQKGKTRHMHISKEYSGLLISSLEKELEKGNCILHLHGFPGGHNEHILRKLDLSKTKVVVQNRGGSFKFQKYSLGKPAVHRKFLEYLDYIYTIFFRRRYLRNIDCFLMNTKAAIHTIKKMGFKNISLHKDGVDFNFFNIGDKALARKKLSLPINKKIIIYTGNFYSDKGVDKIINIYQNIKKKVPVHLILIGGTKKDELYSMAIESGAKVVTRVPNSSLKDYYQASDLSIAIYNDLIVKYGGFGRSTLEAFACGVPFVSQNLIHFAGSKKERFHLGEIPNSLELSELERCIMKILHNQENYTNCRSISKKYYDLNSTVKKNIVVYNSLK